LRLDLTTVHDDDPIIRSDLVDEMGCPQYRDAVSRRQFVHVIDNALAGGNVQSDGRFVQQQQSGFVQQGTRHLDTASIASTQLPNFLVPKFFEGEPFELKFDP
jgi:hypothetical protein